MSIVRALKDPRDPTARDEFRNFFEYDPELLRKKPEELSQKVQAGNGYEEFIRLLSCHQREGLRGFLELHVNFNAV
jgi:hypothetical protein